MSKKLVFVLAGLSLVLVSCEALSITHIAPPAPENDSQLTRGRRIYLTTCVRCHAPEPVSKYSRTQWAEIMPEMIADSKLSPADANAVTRYVESFSQ